MLRPTAIEVIPEKNYHLKIKFDNMEEKIFDVSPYIKGSFYGHLKDINYFNSVHTNGYSVEWPEGQDLCPDELYYSSKTYK